MNPIPRTTCKVPDCKYAKGDQCTVAILKHGPTPDGKTALCLSCHIYPHPTTDTILPRPPLTPQPSTPTTKEPPRDDYTPCA